MDKLSLETRLIEFSILVFHITKYIRRNEFGQIIIKQVLRSTLSPALNYAEAQGAESQKDFIHKLRIVLKELRESYVSLRIIKHSQICESTSRLDEAMDECNQLISIFVSSIKTANRRA